MEVEVKLCLTDANAHRRDTSLLSTFHVVTHRQKNLFFDGVASELSERRVVLREDEEKLDPRVGRECITEPGKLGSVEFRVLRRVKEEFGIEKGFIGLGGFGRR
ncbi:hypothetical protein V8G54_009623 [Vigna mungo]|uniref:CYTH domain-containing protein n=1 Tax=Vigna mungo TaxID=3915 RepID=A0AAQ3NX33_VIGMU